MFASSFSTYSSCVLLTQTQQNWQQLQYQFFYGNIPAEAHEVKFNLVLNLSYLWLVQEVVKSKLSPPKKEHIKIINWGSKVVFKMAV